ncbi:hypothetical protein COS31_03460 [Candidatus Roizmanbacteria bacterium CG02_land_8_20_14_3_00_36_15]|uniref:ParB/Spo0J HTH domain-containing protein n=2 Tax=Candidatus Roizmaniibacteriota TaxID=1752723 RepID=A0A2M8KML7_9BACT|nr:MAG: hypothetical protein COS51_03670 [Candidatus Roizmanbacteria bacterium CG03_land_8_20_14_0_80_36_21]PIV37623.1 MAG: hypothetical protein COS31_03460 [Candidatus Roizmanbacteria bacterium CG02_land_8_20_14_3_00_36_15]PIY70213.1 MAG: hypothetical protein COY89_02335 [Candidatus Roizmanbacteria bacterium CG_4_10_14_0_8_um_filter_36_36]PJA53063.1 MAG: hypothetical protein CO166_03265 [Candidatus Roizmanbacteria bacterium CG_4_9_14_3_um_filter_36_11]PJC82097.1 MAG: hypothetical protein CO007
MNSQQEALISRVRMEKDPFVKAKILQSLRKDSGLRLKDLALKINLKPAYLCHYLRLNRLPEMIVDGYYAEDISLSHLFVISRLKDPKKIIDVYEKVLGKNLTVLATEEIVREILYGIKTEGEALTREEKESYRQQLGKEIKLKIIQTRIKSKLEIEVKGSLAKTTKILRTILTNLKDS